MRIINKSMDIRDLENEEAKKIIQELMELNKKYEEKGCTISSWFGQCHPTEYGKKISLLNRGYDYKPILQNEEFDFKYPNWLLWEIYWVCSNINVKKGDTILDIGGACSLFSFYLASKGVKVVAIDLNQKVVDEANRIAKIMNVDYTAVCSDAEEYLINTNEKFDYITSICVFEHIEKNKRKRLTKFLHKRLKKDGIIAITFDYKNPSRFVGIDNKADIQDLFLTDTNLKMIENKDFYDNNENYLINVFYRKPILWREKRKGIRNKEFPFYEFFRTKNYNDYNFGDIFLKAKN